jgi:hypothetical protein
VFRPMLINNAGRHSSSFPAAGTLGCRNVVVVLVLVADQYTQHTDAVTAAAASAAVSESSTRLTQIAKLCGSRCVCVRAGYFVYNWP